MSLDVNLHSRPCPTCGRKDELHWQNITHNLGGMAYEAGIYGIIWRPDENDIKVAGDLIEPLRKAIAEMERDPERFKKHDAPTGWGVYRDFLPWLKRYLAACEKRPDAIIEVDR